MAHLLMRLFQSLVGLELVHRLCLHSHLPLVACKVLACKFMYLSNNYDSQSLSIFFKYHSLGDGSSGPELSGFHLKWGAQGKLPN